METETTNKNRNYKVGGLAFTGCMFLGWGISSLLGYGMVGMYIGMGVGFITMAILANRKTQ